MLALKASEVGAYPLYRVSYPDGCFDRPEVLTVGQADFEVARHEGTPSVNAFHWSGITGPTTLVVEALDQGCPF